MANQVLKKVIVALGRMGVKADINTNSPFIHYQSEQPPTIKLLREKHNKEMSYKKSHTNITAKWLVFR